MLLIFKESINKGEVIKNDFFCCAGSEMFACQSLFGCYCLCLSFVLKEGQEINLCVCCQCCVCLCASVSLVAFNVLSFVYTHIVNKNIT